MKRAIHLISIILFCLNSHSKDYPPYHPFKSEEAEKEYHAYYDRESLNWPEPSESKMVETSYGSTFVRIRESTDAPALVIMPECGIFC